MRSMKKIVGWPIVVASCIALAGCAIDYEGPAPSLLEETARADIAAKDPSSFPLVRIIRGPYVEHEAIETSEEERVLLRRRVSIYVKDMAFRDAIDYLLSQERIPYFLEEDLSALLETPVTFAFEGEVGVATSRLAGLVGGGMRVRDEVVQLYLNATRDFAVALPGGDISWNMSAGGSQLGGVSGGSGGSGGGGGGGSSGGGGGGSGGGSTVSDTGTITASASLDLWEDVSSSLEEFLGERGTFHVSPAAGLVTVTAPVGVLREVEGFIEAINHQLTRRVEVEFRLLEVQLTDDSSFGINWRAVVGSTPGGLDFSLAGGGAIPDGFGVEGLSTGQARFRDIDGPAGDPDNQTEVASALINALRKQGHVTVSHAPRAITLNNQPVILSDITTEAYLASTTPGVSSGSLTSGGSGGVGLQPGEISTGTQFMIIPKIVGNDVVVYLQAIIASSLGFAEFSSGSGSEIQTIQIPRVSSKGFAVRVKLRNGTAAVIGGLSREASDFSEDSPFFIDILGQSNRQTNRIETVLMITARTLEG